MLDEKWIKRLDELIDADHQIGEMGSAEYKALSEFITSYATQISDTLEAALKVVRAAENVSAYAYRMGDRHPVIHALNDALKPFAKAASEG